MTTKEIAVPISQKSINIGEGANEEVEVFTLPCKQPKRPPLRTKSGMNLLLPSVSASSDVV